jgi:uncharacterized protein (DUF302 family)
METGIVSKLSPYSVAKTLDRLETVVRGNGIKIFALINQEAESEQVGLPLEALVSEAEDSQVWLRYNSPAYLQ